MENDIRIEDDVLKWELKGRVTEDDIVDLISVSQEIDQKIKQSLEHSGKTLSLLADMSMLKDIEPMARDVLVAMFKRLNDYTTRCASVIRSEEIKEIYDTVTTLSGYKIRNFPKAGDALDYLRS